MRLPVRLVTLSSCESGLGVTNDGDEFLGLVRALLQTGTPSLLVSLWPVDDISTSILMQAFYQAVAGGQGRAEALRAAQRTVRATRIGEVLAYCERAVADLGDGDEAGRLTLRWGIADLRYRARDFVRASTDYMSLATDLAPGDVGRRRLTIAAARCRRAAGSHLTADYSLPAFDHPYHWAAFQLVGDWR